MSQKKRAWAIRAFVVAFLVLTLVFQSDRAGGQGSNDLWMSTRAASTKPFGEPVNLGPSVNSAADDARGCLSADSRTLYFTSQRPGGHGG